MKCRTDPKSRRPTYHGNSLERGGRSDKCDGSAEEFQVSGTSWTVTFPNKKKREREKKNSEEQKAAGVTLPVTTEPKRRREEKRQT